MQIKNERPPIYEALYRAGLRPDLENTVFTYGDTIYNPSAREIPNHLIEHEKTHILQQGDDPDGWWNRYIQDPYFRIDQEVEAYANQYKFICHKVKDRNARHKILLQFANSLSSPRYGGIILSQDAYKMIKSK